MNINLFAWIREGVKQSVLQGVSDAVETLGSPEGGDELRQNLLASLRGPARLESPPASDIPGRKRLGRSLRDLERKDSPEA